MSATDDTGGTNGGPSAAGPGLSPLAEWLALNADGDSAGGPGSDQSAPDHISTCVCADCLAAGVNGHSDAGQDIAGDGPIGFPLLSLDPNLVLSFDPGTVPYLGPVTPQPGLIIENGLPFDGEMFIGGGQIDDQIVADLLANSPFGAGPSGENVIDAGGYRVTLTNDLIIDLADGVSDELIASVMHDLGASVLNGAGQDLQLWSISSDVDTATAMLGDLGIASAVERNGVIENAISSTILTNWTAPPPSLTATSVTPNDPYFSSTWGMNKIGAPQAWARETGSSSVIVGVIDSGIDIDHPDLINNLWVNTGEIWGDGIDNDGNGYIDDYNGFDFVRNQGIGPGYAYDDENGHGTHVAGTIAAEGNNGIGVAGVAWDAQLMNAKFLDVSGNGSYYNAVRAIQYTTNNGAQITNNSWGGTSGFSLLQTAIDQARQAGSLFIAAAGNDGRDTDIYGHYPSKYPNDNIISVASTTSSDGRSYFSNYGDVTVDLGAPGHSIYSTTIGGGYGYKSGTSMAAPHVAGAAALLLAADPTLTYAELRDALLDSVDPVSSMNGTTVTGGRLNVDAALASIDAGPPPPPPTPVTGIYLSDSIVDENAPGEVVGTLSTSGGAGGVTYSIESDHSGKFEIRGSDLALKSGESLDHEASLSYGLVLRTTDAFGSSIAGNFTISVSDVNEAPTWSSGDGSVIVSDEIEVGTELDTYRASDPDAGDTVTYQLIHNPGSRFAVDAETGVLSLIAPLDYDTANEYTLVLRATDSGGLDVERTLSIQVTSALDKPTIGFAETTGTVTEILDNAPGEGTTVHTDSGRIEFSDRNIEEGHTVTVVPHSSSGYEGAFTASVVNSATGDGSGEIEWTFTATDSEIENLGMGDGQTMVQSYDIIITDDLGNSVTQAVNIDINGAFDASTLTSGITSVSIDELIDGHPDEGTKSNFRQGDFGIFAVDFGPPFTISTADVPSGYLGTFNALLNPSGNRVLWDFQVNDSQIDHLEAGETVRQEYAVTVSRDGEDITQIIDVTLNGAAEDNTAPEIEFKHPGVEDGLYFRTQSAGTSERDIYRLNTDGSVELAANTPDESVYYRSEMGANESGLYFFSGTGTNEERLHRLTPGGQLELVGDAPGTSSSYQFYDVGDAVYYRAWNQSARTEQLYRIDGDGNFSSTGYSIGRDGVVHEGSLYFAAGSSIYRIGEDGVRHHVSAAPSGVQDFVSFDGDVHLNSSNGLYRLTDAGALESVPGTTSFVRSYTRASLGDSLYFTGFSTPSDYELYRLQSDGTISQIGTNISMGGGSPKEFNGELYFGEDDDLWKITADGTATFVSDLRVPDRFEVFDGNLYFQGQIGSDIELYKIDSAGVLSTVATDPGLRVDSYSPFYAVDSGQSGPPAYETEEHTPVTIAGIRVKDIDAFDMPIQISLDAANGSLALNSTQGLSLIDGDGADGSLLVSGSIADINAALVTGVIYTPETGFNGTESLSITANDGNGGVTTGALDITVLDNGVDENIIPVISGDNTGSIYEDGAAQAEGALTATDPNAGAVLTWSLQGGTEVNGAPDYNFAIDNLAITKNGNAGYYVDDFGDGIAPPTGATFSGGDPASYATMGTFTETGGRAVMDGASAGQFTSSLNGQVYNNHTATLNTHVGPLSDPRGLKIDDDFAVEARFDLVIPDTAGESYGIRLLDDVSFGGTGDDILRLRVVRHANGNVSVSFDELDTLSQDITHIQGELLNPATGDDQIVLRLSHDASNPGVIRAAYILLDDGVITSSSIFGFTGQIFGTETPGDTSDDEVFTRVRIRAVSSDGAIGEKITGAYGTLILDENGQWSYDLDNDAAAVQALAAGQTAVDSFTAVVTDEHGAADTQAIDITVTGVNDGPVFGGGTTAGDITEIATGQPGEDTATHTATGAISFADVDLTDAHSVTVTPRAGGYRGALTASVSDAATGDGAGQVTWSYSIGDAAIGDLDDGDALTQIYDVTIDDGNGGIVTQAVTLTLNGTTDVVPNTAPKIDFGAGEEELYFTASFSGAGYELGKLNRAGEVSLVADIRTGTSYGMPNSYTEFAGNLYFAANEETASGYTDYALYKVDRDGSVSHVESLSTEFVTTPFRELTVFNGDLYFNAWGEGVKDELYRMDADENVELVSDINPGAGRSVPQFLTLFDNALYFKATSGTHGAEIHRVGSDGSVERMTNFAGGAGTLFYGMTALGDSLYFSADLEDGNGIEIYRYQNDGTVSLAADVFAGSDSSTSTDLIGFNGSLYFNGTDDGINRELFRYDTSDGSVTEIILDAGRYSRPTSFTEIDGSIYFGGQSGIYRINPDHSITQLTVQSGSSGMHFTNFNGAIYAYRGGGIYRIESDDTVSQVPNTNRVSFNGSLAAFASGNGSQQTETEESTPLALSSITVADSDNDPLSLNLSVANGTLALASTSGLTFTDADGSDGTLAFSGTLSDLNAAFAGGLTYTPEDGFNGTESLSVTADDGNGGVTAGTLDITVLDNGIDETTQTGTEGDDTLTGTAQADTLRGLGGNDVLNGGAGDDMLNGGAGADALNGGTGIDTAAYSSPASNLLLGSEDPTGAPWVSNDVDIALIDAASVPAALGGIAGHRFSADESGGTAFQRIKGAGGSAFSFSAYVSAVPAAGGGVESQWLVMVASDSSGNETRAYFDMINGVTGSSAAVGGASLSGMFAESVSGGWHRVGYSYTMPSDVVAVRLYAVDSDGATVTSAGDGFMAAGLQVSEGATALPYMPASEAPVGGVVANLSDPSENTGEAAGDSYDSVENISGTDHGDILTGDDGDNALDGNGGADVLRGGGGNDVLTGGAGMDRYLFARGDGADIVINTGESASGDTAVFGELVDSDQLWFARSGDDLVATVIGTTNTVTVRDWYVGTGNRLDFVSGSDDLLAADDVEALVTAMGTLTPPAIGETTLPAAQAAALAGVLAASWQAGAGDPDGATEGDDVLNGDDLDNILAGGGGSDTLDGGDGHDTLFGDDSLVETRGIAALNDGAGGLAAGSDYLFGRTGNDTLVGGAGGDYLDGGSGFDTASYQDADGNVVANLEDESQNTGFAGGDRFIGIEGLQGSDYDDALTGDGGQNRIDGGAGADAMAGGQGDDIYVVDRQADRVTERWDSGTDTVESSVGYGLYSNVENLTLTGTDDIFAHGNALRNTLIGNSGDNLLDGKGGRDIMRGGSGDDTYILDSLDDTISELWGQGTDTVRSSIGYGLYSNIENLTLTGSQNIFGHGNALHNTLTGNSGDNFLSGLRGSDRLFGQAGNDTLDGGSGRDLLDGGLGTDQMSGGEGDDTYVVDRLSDRVIERWAEGIDTVESSIGYGLYSNIENLTLTGSDDIFAHGNALRNTLIGNSGDNLIDGKGGRDTMLGGHGDDTYVIDSADDRISEFWAQGTDTVRSSVGYGLYSNIENLTLTGAGNIFGHGNALRNTLVGNNGDNSLKAHGGADALFGGAGDDTLDGGSGNDVLSGDEGNDILRGGTGIDVAMYAGPEDGYSILLDDASGNWTVTDIDLSNGNSGVDTLTDIEMVNFGGNVQQLINAIATFTSPETDTSDLAGTFSDNSSNEFAILTASSW